MRGSVQYPSHDLAVKAGVCLLALVVFLLGSAWIIAGAQRPSGPVVAIELSAQTLPHGVVSGNVYFLNEAQGTILQVGRFFSGNEETKLSLRLPEKVFDADQRWSLQFWQSGYDSYRPYAQFINDDRLRHRFSAIVSDAFRDPGLREAAESLGRDVFQELFAKAEPYFKEITNDPEFRSLMIDVAIEDGTRLLPRGNRLELERTWVGPMIELVISKARHWPWDEWISEIISDPGKQELFSELLSDMEPFFREALQEFLWNRDQVLRPGPEYAPNVRLLWVARRTLFGAREPAITLMLAPEGQELNENQELRIREIR